MATGIKDSLRLFNLPSFTLRAKNIAIKISSANFKSSAGWNVPIPKLNQRHAPPVQSASGTFKAPKSASRTHNIKAVNNNFEAICLQNVIGRKAEIAKADIPIKRYSNCRCIKWASSSDVPARFIVSTRAGLIAYRTIRPINNSMPI